MALTYSSGPGTVVIPAVVGAKAADAAKVLQGLGFTTRFAVRAVPAAADRHGQRHLTRTRELRWRSPPAVVVTIDVVSNQTTVPTLTSVSQAVAQSLLTAADLQANVVAQDSKTVPDGVVLEQSVPAAVDGHPQRASSRSSSATT